MTKQIMVGGVAVGGGAPVTIQSMCNTQTEDVRRDRRADPAPGAGGLRDRAGGRADAGGGGGGRRPSRRGIHIPLVADIHFDYRLAHRRGGARRGQDPHQPRQHRRRRTGCGRWRTACRAHERAHPHRRQRRLAGEGAAGKVRRRDRRRRWWRARWAMSRCWSECDFDGHLHLREMLRRAGQHGGLPAAARSRVDYPLHLGVTEAGTPAMGVLKSAIGIGGLLCRGHRRHHPRFA